MLVVAKRQSISIDLSEYNERHPVPFTHNDELFERGTVVVVQGERGKTYTFHHANLRKDGTLDSFTVHAPNEGFRHFVPERVSHKPVKATRRRKAKA